MSVILIAAEPGIARRSRQTHAAAPNQVEVDEALLSEAIPVARLSALGSFGGPRCTKSTRG